MIQKLIYKPNMKTNKCFETTFIVSSVLCSAALCVFEHWPHPPEPVLDKHQRNIVYYTHKNAAVMENRMPSPVISASHPWFQLWPHKVSHFGVLQLPGKAHLVRRACLGSCPCLHGELELMVLKWRPDGDRGLIAAEGAPVSRPLLLSSYRTSLSICSSHPTIIHLPVHPRSAPGLYFLCGCDSRLVVH